MKSILVLALIALFSSAVHGGSYFPKSININVSHSVEIYHLSTDCWFENYEGQEPSKYWSVYLGKTTDMSIRDTADYCSIYTNDVTTTCEEDIQPYMDVISGSGVCELRIHSHSPGSAGGEALCKGPRSTVVSMIFELCSIMLNAE